jgi:imidazolonepropionase-like amidohydrolase
MYVEAGMTPLQAIQSATLVAARLLRMEKKIGQVAPGFFGDLVAVAGDPLLDVRVLESPRAVVKEGRLVFSKP